MSDIAGLVAARLREYTATFVRSVRERNATLMRPYCHLPGTAFGGGRAITIATPEENDERWRAAARALPDDYRESRLMAVDVTLVDETVAWITADCARFNTAGLEYHRYYSSYLMALVDEEWKITTWVAHGDGEPTTTRH